MKIDRGLIKKSCTTCDGYEEELVGDGTRYRVKCLVGVEKPSARHCKFYTPSDEAMKGEKRVYPRP